MSSYSSRTTQVPSPSSPALSSSSWASIPPLTPLTPGDTPPPTIDEREAILSKAIQSLADEKAELAREKSLREQERKTNALDRENLDALRGKLKAYRATLDREMARVAAEKQCNVLAHSYNDNSEVWELFVMAVKGLACVIPVVFLLRTTVEVQVVVCRRLSGWVLGLFGI